MGAKEQPYLTSKHVTVNNTPGGEKIPTYIKRICNLQWCKKN
jgi:hypothetical protein